MLVVKTSAVKCRHWSRVLPSACSGDEQCQVQALESSAGCEGECCQVQAVEKSELTVTNTATNRN